MEIDINNKIYIIKNDDFNIVDKELLSNMVTDYYDSFNYIVGDYAYNKLRLKGFYDSNNKKVKKYNDIKYLDNYLKKYCAYGCKWFCLKKK